MAGPERRSGAPFSLLLTLFFSVNQAFFMGLFFLLAGVFTPPPLASRGALRFMAGWVLWHRLQPVATAPASPAPVPGDRAWRLAALGVGGAALAIRQVVPVGQERWGLQVGYFASYVFLFVLGCQAARHQWLQRMDRAQARRWCWWPAPACHSCWPAGCGACLAQGGCCRQQLSCKVSPLPPAP